MDYWSLWGWRAPPTFYKQIIWNWDSTINWMKTKIQSYLTHLKDKAKLLQAVLHFQHCINIKQGLEPWTLRLKVWCSTIWATQACRCSLFLWFFLFVLSCISTNNRTLKGLEIIFRSWCWLLILFITGRAAKLLFFKPSRFFSILSGQVGRVLDTT